MPDEPPSPQEGTKRAHPEDEATNEKAEPAILPPSSTAAATSAFRNVSACNRCRVRKNRCDQQLPACAACTKTGAVCVGYDAITKREIPRSYVYFLETRLEYFERLLNEHGISYDAETWNADARPLGSAQAGSPTLSRVHNMPRDDGLRSTASTLREKQEDEKLDNLVSNIGMVSVNGTSDNRYLGATSGISFARVVLSAMKKATPKSNTDRNGFKTVEPASAIRASGSTIRDSYFGLQTKPQIKEAPFPNRDLSERLAALYFEHANPQIPILHREEFSATFEKTYATDAASRTPRQLYLLNIVFAIGAGIIWGSSDAESTTNKNSNKRARLSNQQAQPEEYHASAIVHLGTFLSSNGSGANAGGGGDLEELQAVLLLAGFALLRPVAPGLWYIVGVAMRLAIDLGLHYEDGSGFNDAELEMKVGVGTNSKRADQLGKRQWTRDLRRRLWWCTYSFDRLVSTCVGRPFGITDQIITTDFPSLLDDKYLTHSGITKGVHPAEPSYKRVAHHYFRLRLLQSEIVQVLQYQQAQMTRMKGWNRQDEYVHTKLPSPFLVKHHSFRCWRKDVDQRLFEWKESAPARAETAVAFSPQFLELNYWQAVTMLYRQSLSVPPPFAGERSPTDDIASLSSVMAEDKEEEDLVFLKCAEAGQRTLRLYQQLHRQRLVSYTYLATHHLFMAGISFLYAVWHSPAVRSRITLDDFDFTVLAATSVLSDLTTKCQPAEACRDALERMSKMTLQMCMSSPGLGFGIREEPSRTVPDCVARPARGAQQTSRLRPTMRPIAIRPPPRFDMDLGDLFPNDAHASSRQNVSFRRHRLGTQRSERRPRTIARRTSHPQQEALSSMLHQDSVVPDSEMANIPSSQECQLSPRNDAQHMLQDTTYPFDPASNSYNPDFMSNLPGMEFLSRLSGIGQSHSQEMPGLDMSYIETHQNIDPILNESWMDMDLTGSTDVDVESDWGLGTGFGVGVGMGLDFGPQHDWSDGQGGFNLFDGFFFGGADGSGNVQ